MPQKEIRRLNISQLQTESGRMHVGKQARNRRQIALTFICPGSGMRLPFVVVILMGLRYAFTKFHFIRGLGRSTMLMLAGLMTKLLV